MNKDETKKNVEKPYTDPETGKFKEGNPGGGRPKGSGISITTELKRKLKECPEGQKSTYLQLLIQRIVKQAIQDGDQQMIKNIWNYVDGLPKQTIDHGLQKNIEKIKVEINRGTENNRD